LHIIYILQILSYDQQILADDQQIFANNQQIFAILANICRKNQQIFAKHKMNVSKKISEIFKSL